MSTFTGCHLLLFCLTAAAHCEAAAAVVDLLGQIFCNATAPLVANMGITLTKPPRQVLIERTWVIFQIKLLLFKLNVLLENTITGATAE